MKTKIKDVLSKVLEEAAMVGNVLAVKKRFPETYKKLLSKLSTKEKDTLLNSIEKHNDR